MRSFVHLDITLTGAAQNLGGSLTVAQLNLLLGADVVLERQKQGEPTSQIAALYTSRAIWLQVDQGATNPVYVGGDNTVSSSSWGWRLPAPAGGVPGVPLPIDQAGQIKLTDLWVVGTNTEKLHVMVRAW